MNCIQFQGQIVLNSLVMAEQSAPVNTMNASVRARGRERCILLKNHDQFSVLYIPTFPPTL